MKQRIRFLNNITIRRKLMIILVVFFALLTLIGVNLTSQISSMYNQNFQNITDTSIKQLKTNIINKMGEWANSIDALVDNPSLYRFLRTDYTSDYEAYIKYVEDIQPFIRNIVKGISIDDVKVYSNNATLGISGVTNNPLFELNEVTWYDGERSVRNGYNWVFTSIATGYTEKDFICCYKIRNTGLPLESDDNLIYSIFIDPAKMYNLLSEETKGGNIIILLDAADTVVMSSKAAMVGQSASKVLYTDEITGKSILGIPNNAIIRCVDGEFMLKTTEISSERLFLKGWRLFNLTPVNQLRSDIMQIIITTAIICLLCFVLSLFLMLLVTNNIVKRMNNLIATLKKVRSGLFHSSISVSGRDEISALERYFNETISELNALIQENSDANSKVMQTELRNQRLLNMNREAEIIVLQHQMDPHYLFNTFETIRMELVRSDSRELAGFVRAFADNVRASLYAGDVMYALGDELNLLNDFIIVQKFRYGDRMIFEISVDPSLLDCRIPKLSIQPLLENAVFHGVEPALGQRSIQIAITRSSDILTVRVHDDGQGIDQQRLTELRDIIYQDEDAARKALNGKCSALRNVHWRSILIYGPDFGITIDSRKGEFTETTLRIRYSNEEKSLGKEGGSLPCTDA